MLGFLPAIVILYINRVSALWDEIPSGPRSMMIKLYKDAVHASGGEGDCISALGLICIVRRYAVTPSARVGSRRASGLICCYKPCTRQGLKCCSVTPV